MFYPELPRLKQKRIVYVSNVVFDLWQLGRFSHLKKIFVASPALYFALCLGLMEKKLPLLHDFCQLFSFINFDNSACNFMLSIVLYHKTFLLERIYIFSSCSHSSKRNGIGTLTWWLLLGANDRQQNFIESFFVLTLATYGMAYMYGMRSICKLSVVFTSYWAQSASSLLLYWKISIASNSLLHIYIRIVFTPKSNVLQKVLLSVANWALGGAGDERGNSDKVPVYIHKYIHRSLVIIICGKCFFSLSSIFVFSSMTYNGCKIVFFLSFFFQYGIFY